MPDSEELIASLRVSFQGETRVCLEQERLPFPDTPQEWRSWLTNQACMNMYYGVQIGDPTRYRYMLTLLAALRSLVSLGVAFSPKIPPFPKFLFQSENVAGRYTSEVNDANEKTFREVIAQLDRALDIGLHIQEFCELEGVPNPENVWEWCAVLIRMGCIMLCNIRSFLREDASEAERMEEAEKRMSLDLHEIDDAIIVFRGVEALLSQGIYPSPKIKVFPTLTQTE